MLSSVPEQALLVGSILALSFGFQSAIGFGGGIISISLMLAGGFALPEAIEIASLAALLQSIVSCFMLRKEISWNDLYIPHLMRLLGLFVGTVLLHIIVSSFDKSDIRAIVGVIILCQLFMRISAGRKQKERVSPVYSAAMLLGSGICLGSVGMGGPFAILWASAHRWRALKIKATLFCLYIPSLLVQIALIPFVFGKSAGHAALVGLFSLPGCLCGTLLGLWIGKLINRRQLLIIAYVFLTFISIRAIAAAL